MKMYHAPQYNSTISLIKASETSPRGVLTSVLFVMKNAATTDVGQPYFRTFEYDVPIVDHLEKKIGRGA